MNKVSLCSERGFRVKLNLDGDARVTLDYVKPPEQRIRRYYMFRQEVAICITEFGYLGLSINGEPWKMHNLIPTLHGVPTSALFFVCLLVIGLDSGLLYIRNIDIDHLDNIKFDSISSRCIRLDTKAIVSLDIMDYYGQQYLIAASNTTVHILKFP